MTRINNDIKIIPNTKIVVPKIDRDIFIDGIIDVLKDLKDEKYYVNTFSEMKDALIFDENMDISNELDEFVTDNINLSSENAIVTAGEYQGIEFDSILGIKETSNGFVFWGTLVCGDWETFSIRIIYFDGNKFQSYVPHYGNCINWNNDSALGNDYDEDEDFLNKFNLSCNDLKSLKDRDLIDTSMILQELETVFQLQGSYNGTITNNKSTPCNNTIGNTSNNVNNTAQIKQSVSDVLLQIFEQRSYSLIYPLQQSILNQGFQSYDKSLCFKNIKNKEIMLKDIYNYIVLFDNNRDNTYKTIECQKIVTYIKKYKYHHEGYL